jgi:hypothetical protein
MLSRIPALSSSLPEATYFSVLKKKEYFFMRSFPLTVNCHPKAKMVYLKYYIFQCVRSAHGNLGRIENELLLYPLCVAYGFWHVISSTACGLWQMGYGTS